MTTHRHLPALLLGLDLVATVLVFNAMIRFRGLNVADGIILEPLAMPCLAVIFSIYLIEGYSLRTDMLRVDYTSQHTIALLGAMLGTLLITFVFIYSGYELQSSRFVIALSFIALMPVTLAYRRFLYLRFFPRREARSIVFVGDLSSRELFREECLKMGTTHPVVYGTVDQKTGGSDATVPPDGALPFHQILNDIRAQRLAVEAIVLRESARELVPRVSRELVGLYFAGVPTYTLELFHQVYWRKIPVYRLNQTWLFQEGFRIAREPVFDRLKRITDIALAGGGLALTSPIILASALAIWLEDRGKVFFVQTRIGKNHVSFPIVKLRTMRSDDGKGALYTLPHDARITKVGRFLRAARLDELPQLWNVLRGDMSLIGPRPEWARLVDQYERDIPCYHFRHLVKPGITGWAQVNYPYGANIDDTVRKLEYDLYYIRHFSFVLDATIALKTIHIMIFGKGQ